MPLTPRARSAGARANDERILDAAVAELAADGIDRLRMNATASRCGLTTGALYSRYESAAELAVHVWQTRLRDRHHAHLDAVVTYLVDGRCDAEATYRTAVNRLRRPTPADLATIELLVAARRIDELEEVIVDDVHRWVAGWRATRGRDRARRAEVLSTLGFYWGAALYGLPGARGHDWDRVLRRFAPALADEGAAGAASGRVRPAPMIDPVAATGEPLRDALIDATAEVIARSGVERATVSRIARRAGMTDGAVYTRYATKGDLVADAVDVLLARVVAADAEAVARALEGNDLADALASIGAGGLAPGRQRWRHFRLEAFLASRHVPQVRRLLRRRIAANVTGYRPLLGDDAEPFGAAGQAWPLGMSAVQLYVDDLASVDLRRVLAVQAQVLTGQGGA